MADRPVGRGVQCPGCKASTTAIVPAASVLVAVDTDDGVDADGKVWATCESCEERFLVHYRIDN